jgi:hypothetical protein
LHVDQYWASARNGQRSKNDGRALSRASARLRSSGPLAGVAAKISGTRERGTRRPRNRRPPAKIPRTSRRPLTAASRAWGFCGSLWRRRGQSFGLLRRQGAPEKRAWMPGRGGRGRAEPRGRRQIFHAVPVSGLWLFRLFPLRGDDDGRNGRPLPEESPGIQARARAGRRAYRLGGVRRRGKARRKSLSAAPGRRSPQAGQGRPGPPQGKAGGFGGRQADFFPARLPAGVSPAFMWRAGMAEKNPLPAF